MLAYTVNVLLLFYHEGGGSYKPFLFISMIFFVLVQKIFIRSSNMQYTTSNWKYYNRLVKDTGSENSEEVKATHPPSELNDFTLEEPNIKEQL